MTKTTESFNKNYAILKDVAEKLRSQTEPDVDALIPMVESATKAYKQCQDRIEAVKKALAKHLPEEDKE